MGAGDLGPQVLSEEGAGVRDPGRSVEEDRAGGLGA